MTDNRTPEDNSSGLRLTRRRAIAGAAWSVPVITVATAAPAFAASGTATVTAIDGYPGGTKSSSTTTSRYLCAFSARNDSTTTQTVTLAITLQPNTAALDTTDNNNATNGFTGTGTVSGNSVTFTSTVAKTIAAGGNAGNIRASFLKSSLDLTLGGGTNGPGKPSSAVVTVLQNGVAVSSTPLTLNN